MNFSIILALLVSIYFGFSQTDDSEQGCATLARCLQEAYDLRKVCEANETEINKKWPTNQTQIDKDVESLNQMTDVQRLDKINCLKASLNKTVVATCDVTMKANCSKWIAAYKPKTKRQAPPPPTTSTTTTTHPSTTITPSLAQLAKEIADEESKVKADNAAETALKNEQNAELAAADRVNHNNMQKSLSDCNTKVAAIEAECNQMAPCCSEHPICDLAYQATSQFTDCVKLTSKLELERRTKVCPAPPPAPAKPAPPPVAPAASG